MYRHILIATDGSSLAGHAVTHGLALAKALGARVKVVTVTELWSATEMASQAAIGKLRPTDEYEAKEHALAMKILESAKHAAEIAGVPCETLHVADMHPAEGIVSAAVEHGCDLIVMASHGRRGLERLVLGSQASAVLARSKAPVLICR